MKRVVSLLISLGIILLIYQQADLSQFMRILAYSSPTWMVLSLGMIVPLNIFTALRLQLLTPPKAAMTHWEANKLILAASTLNMVLPSKMGDMAKALFMNQRGKMSLSLAFSCVVFEKGCDVLSLLLWCLLALLLYPEKASLFRGVVLNESTVSSVTSLTTYWMITAGIAAMFFLGLLCLASPAVARTLLRCGGRVAPENLKNRLEQLACSWAEMHNYFWQHSARLTIVVLLSLFLWFLHLLQIWLFVVALHQQVPFSVVYALTPLAILAGLLPFTMAGVGTRDAALLFFYSPFMPEAAALALGILCTARYLLPAIGGIPFMTDYLYKIRDSSSKTKV